MSENSKKLILIMIFFAIVVIVVPFIFFIKKEQKANTPAVVDKDMPKIEMEEEEEEEESNDPAKLLEEMLDSSKSLGRLPMGEEKIGFDFEENQDSYKVEYLSFFNFFEEIEDDVDVSFSDYSLPLNVKTDVVNYYDLSRRLRMDKHLDNLNNNGFSILENQLEAESFYGIYDELYDKDMPLLITSDFLIYYYQQSIKDVFKSVEKNIFYKNLWDINYVLYDKAKKRYEDHLAEVGNINDRVLEAERLAVAYFATSLELLKPKEEQIASAGDLERPEMFSSMEGSIYTFQLPEYLEVDVLKELSYIEERRNVYKSPVLLYDRNYKDFIIPEEYSKNAKLNNFYLATKWLSSTFPLHYRGEDCPECYLDFDDWRISMIGSAIISDDIFNSHNLKNDWARIYKTLAFFKGLRGDLSYVHYRDALSYIFGEDYSIAEIFADSNPENVDNLYKFQERILKYEFLEIEGALDRNDSVDKPKVGVKMLADFYWPNDYIFNQLSYPKVTSYQGDSNSIPDSNVTACKVNGDTQRCNGFSLDIVKLVFDKNLDTNGYYKENSKYDKYLDQIAHLKGQIEEFSDIWHYNVYWQSLEIIKKLLAVNSDFLPSFTKNPNWENRKLHTAVSSWVNAQLPNDDLKVYQKFQRGITDSAEFSFMKNSYIEPNLDLVNEQIASIEMINEMFSLLKINEEIRTLAVDLEEIKSNLVRAKEIMIKELQGEPLSVDDVNFIAVFSREYEVFSPGEKKLIIDDNEKISYDISDPKLLLIIFNRDGENYMAVGPTFSYIEKR
jgi:hypothetical protein